MYPTCKQAAWELDSSLTCKDQSWCMRAYPFKVDDVILLCYSFILFGKYFASFLTNLVSKCDLKVDKAILLNLGFCWSSEDFFPSP